MAILVFAGVLSVPSAVFAEASWYGSLRVGVQSSDSKLSVVDGASRWGIRGSVDAGEGLTGVYRFETKIGANNASSPGGRLSYVGLSGAFGSVTLGQIWSASFNATGAMTDNTNYYGDSETTYRHGNVVSYAFSNDLMSLQADLNYDDGNNKPNDDLQKTEFGLTVNLGDIGTVAVAYIDDKYKAMNQDVSDAQDGSDIANTKWRVKTTQVVAQASVAGLTVYAGSGKVKSQNLGGAVTTTDGEPTDTDSTTGNAYTVPAAKTTFFGVRGSLGDTGLGYVFSWRDKETYKPWSLTLNKGLGDSTTLSLEHANNDNNSANKTQLGLKINF